MLMIDLRHDLVQRRLAPTEQMDMDEFTKAWHELEQRMLEIFADEGRAAGEVIFARSADMRYLGQEHTVNVPIPNGDLDEAQRQNIERKFHELHEQLYTFRQNSPIELVNLRLAGFGAVRKPELQQIAVNKDIHSAQKGTRLVDFDELGRYETSIYERGSLGAQRQFTPRAVVDGSGAAGVVFRGDSFAAASSRIL